MIVVIGNVLVGLLGLSLFTATVRLSRYRVRPARDSQRARRYLTAPRGELDPGDRAALQRCA